MEIEDRVRVTIKHVRPEIEGGRYPIKRVIGDAVIVEAAIFADGHDVISARLCYRHEAASRWFESPMQPGANDRWSGEFFVTELGSYRYTITAWIDRFKSWRRDFAKRVEAAQEDLSVNLLVGSRLVAAAAERANKVDKPLLLERARIMAAGDVPETKRIDAALAEVLADLMVENGERSFAGTYPVQLPVVVDREKAVFSTWYELFPRSCAPQPGRHGTFKDCEARLPYLHEMGFDVLYLPPVHPIGRTARKGKNNSLVAGPDDPGTPWAIGSSEGGHTYVHPELGTVEDLRRLGDRAREFGIDLALDMAFQCSPDHPWVAEHPDWFYRRPDGSIQYAENPPKKYQDIYPLDFECDQWQALWTELKGVVMFWAEQGIRIFRVDNPHTKPFHFWEWLITGVKAAYPEAIFLAEAFTRPSVMYQLGELGFSQSYTYFAWRNTKWELTEYFTEMTRSEVSEFFRPNLWPNTPDILPEYLQHGGRPGFMVRLVLAATLGASYGIYGPAFELCEGRAREPGSEEYLDSEKYELKHWDIDRPDSLREFIARVNRVRRENPALQRNANLNFHPIDNEMLVCYTKHTADLSDIILVVVNLDPHHKHSGWLQLPLERLGLEPRQPYQVHDLLSGARYLWQGARNYVELDPDQSPAHILRIRRRILTERDFDYYL